MKKHGWKVLAAVAVAAGAVALGLWWTDTTGAASLPDGIVAASGRIEARRVRVASAVDGRVLALHVAEGDRIEAGDRIIRLDDRSLEATVRRTRASVAAAEAAEEEAGRRIGALEVRLALARREAERTRRLYQENAVSRQELDRAEATVDQLEAERRAAESARESSRQRAEAARADRRSARIRLGEARVTAPADGRVEHQLVRVGEMTSHGQPLVTLLLTDSMEVRVYLPLETAGRISAGDEARVYLDAHPDRFFRGTVERVASDAEFTPRDVHMPDDRTTLVYGVDIRVGEGRGELADGFPADVFLRVDPSVPWPERAPW